VDLRTEAGVEESSQVGFVAVGGRGVEQKGLKKTNHVLCQVHAFDSREGSEFDGQLAQEALSETGCTSRCDQRITTTWPGNEGEPGVVGDLADAKEEDLNDRICGIDDADDPLLQLLHPVGGSPGGDRLKEGVAGWEVAIDRLTGHAESGRNFGHIGAVAVLDDTGNGCLGDPGNRLFIGSGRMSAPAMGSHPINDRRLT